MSIDKHIENRHAITDKIRIVTQVAILKKRAIPKKEVEYHPQFGPIQVDRWHDIKKLDGLQISFEGKDISSKILPEALDQLSQLLKHQLQEKGLVNNAY